MCVLLTPSVLFQIYSLGNQNFPSRFPLIPFRRKQSTTNCFPQCSTYGNQSLMFFIMNRFQWRMGGNAQFPLFGSMKGSIPGIYHIITISLFGLYHRQVSLPLLIFVLKTIFQDGIISIRVSKVSLVKWYELNGRSEILVRFLRSSPSLIFIILMLAKVYSTEH